VRAIGAWAIHIVIRVHLKKKAPTPLRVGAEVCAKPTPRRTRQDRVRRGSTSLQFAFSRSYDQHKISFRDRAVKIRSPEQQSRWPAAELIVLYDLNRASFLLTRDSTRAKTFPIALAIRES